MVELIIKFTIAEIIKDTKGIKRFIKREQGRSHFFQKKKQLKRIYRVFELEMRESIGLDYLSISPCKLK